MNKQDYQGVMVIVQQVDSEVLGATYELIRQGRELAAVRNTKVTAVLLGHQVAALCKSLGAYGADQIILIDDPALEVYTNEPYTKALTAVIEKYKPEIVLLSATAIGRDLAPRVSARIHTGLTADCTGLEIDDETGNFLMTRPAFGGNIMATIVCADFRPQMATVRPGVMQKLNPSETPFSACIVERFSVDSLEESKNVEILEIIKK